MEDTEMTWEEYFRKSQNPPDNYVEQQQPAVQAQPPSPVQEQPSMSSRLKEVLGQYSPELRQKMIERFASSGGDKGFGAAGLWAGIGQAVAGQNPTDVQNNIYDRDKAVLTDNLDIFDAGRKGALESVGFQEKIQELSDDEATQGPEYEQYLELAKQVNVNVPPGTPLRALKKVLGPAMNVYKIKNPKPSGKRTMEEEFALINARAEAAARNRKPEKDQSAPTTSERKDLGKILLEAPGAIQRTRERVDRLKRALELHGEVMSGPLAGRVAGLMPSNKRQEMDSLLSSARVESAPKGQGAVSNFERELYAAGVPGAESDAAPEVLRRLIAEGEAALAEEQATLSYAEETIGRRREPVQHATPTPSSSGEVRRKSPDGRTAVFDANTKKFLRYE